MGEFPTPFDFTDDERIVAEALYADEWTEPNPKYGEEWHKRFPWWMCVAAARIAVRALAAPATYEEGP